MSLSALLDAWQADPNIASNVAAWRTFPARAARFAPFPDTLHPALVEVLREQGIDALYTHQAAAWQCVQAGQNPVVVTGTASGKTMCYNLPVLDRLLRVPETRALYLFPTKALAQDQKETLRQFAASLDGRLAPQDGGRPVRPATAPVATYDGDTPAHERAAVRAAARVLITNPDMLHTGILPHHTGWADFFAHLGFVVIDEMHTYRGVFGSHVANVLRRLKRAARFYGAAPQFILTSATIANPVELAERLVEEPMTLVDDDGAARGARHFLIYNPPVIEPALGLRRSSLVEGVRLAESLLGENVQTIIFALARRAVELMLRHLLQGRSTLPSPMPPSLHRGGGSARSVTSLATALSSFSGQEQGDSERIRGYRSGYLPRQRREIERGLREGSVRVVVATNALELGIDIGGMDAALLVGYPGTIAGTWQQAGRAGRQATGVSGNDACSLAVLIASANPLDQFLAHHPDYFFGRSPEQALIDPDNLLILLEHIRCAAFELPFEAGSSFGRVEGIRVAEFLQFLEQEGVVHQSGGRHFWMADQYPAGGISLRSASADTVVLQTGEGDACTTVGQVDVASAQWMVHPGAVYLHEGQMYLVDELDLDRHIARLQSTDVDYYTEPRSETVVQLVQKWASAEVCGADKACGEIQVTTQVVGYRKVRWFTQEQLGMEPLSLPPSELLTTGYWVTPAEETVARLRDQGMWTNDANRYGPNWAEQRDRARARDGYRCQVCGTQEQGREHHVHHKVPFRAFESYRQANLLSNLVTLCPTCHRRVETAVRVKSGLSGLAFVLGHLAPLFLMCDPGDLGVHWDPQSSLAEGRPAVTIYDQVPGGIGFSERLFGLHDELMSRAAEWVEACVCSDGCPSCVGPAGEHGIGGKWETRALLESLSSYQG